MKKKYSLKKTEDFAVIIKKKKQISSTSFVLYFQENAQSHLRIGFSVSKKLGNAVLRNKVKRQLRMMCQTLVDFEQKKDIILIVRIGYLNKTYEDNRKDLLSLFKKVKIESQSASHSIKERVI